MQPDTHPINNRAVFSASPMTRQSKYAYAPARLSLAKRLSDAPSPVYRIAETAHTSLQRCRQRRPNEPDPDRSALQGMTTMKLYIAKATCSLAVQLVANELGLAPELVHFDVFGKSTSNGSTTTTARPPYRAAPTRRFASSCPRRQAWRQPGRASGRQSTKRARILDRSERRSEQGNEPRQDRQQQPAAC